MRKKTAKTKVLYIITKSNWGGVQRYVFDMATNVAKNGYEAVVTFGGEGTLKNNLENVGIRTISISNLKRDVNMFSEWKVFFNLLKILKAERPDVVHLNSSKIGGLGALAVRVYNILPQGKMLRSNKLTKLKARIIFTAHGWAYKEERSSVSRKMIKFFSWLTVMLSHATITVSVNDFENAPKLFVKRKLK